VAINNHINNEFIGKTGSSLLKFNWGSTFFNNTKDTLYAGEDFTIKKEVYMFLKITSGNNRKYCRHRSLCHVIIELTNWESSRDI
jgi:hypothetical protein